MLINIIAFQLGWFACVLGGANGHPWLGAGFAGLVMLWHVFTCKQKPLEISLIAIALLIGLIFDTIPMHMHWLSFQTTPYWPNTITPVWMLGLWGMLATTLNISLAWLKKNWFLATALGAVSGPLAYLSGSKLGAIVILNMPAAMIYLAIGWGLAIPLLLKLTGSKTLGAAYVA